MTDEIPSLKLYSLSPVPRRFSLRKSILTARAIRHAKEIAGLKLRYLDGMLGEILAESGE